MEHNTTTEEELFRNKKVIAIAGIILLTFPFIPPNLLNSSLGLTIAVTYLYLISSAVFVFHILDWFESNWTEIMKYRSFTR